MLALSRSVAWGHRMQLAYRGQDAFRPERLQERHHVVDRERLREVIALQLGAAELRHRPRLEFGLDALGDDLHAEAAPDRDHRLNDCPRNIDPGGAADKR